MILRAIHAKADTKHFVYVAAAISALDGMLFGYGIGVISGAILFIKSDFSLSAGMDEIVVNAVLLGSLEGAQPAEFWPAALGAEDYRLPPQWFSAWAAALAPGTAWLIIARVVYESTNRNVATPKARAFRALEHE